MELNDAQLLNQAGGQIELLIFGAAAPTVVNVGNTSPTIAGALPTIILNLTNGHTTERYAGDASIAVTLFQTGSPYLVTLFRNAKGKPDHLDIQENGNGKHMADVPLTKI